LSYHRQAIQNVLGHVDPSHVLTEAEVQAVLRETDRLAQAGTAPQPSNDPRRAAPISVSDLELQLAVLTEAGMTRGEAFEAIHTGTGRPTPQMMQAKRAEMQEAADRAAREAFEASPAGKREAAQQALQQRREREELASGARELIRDQWGDAVDQMLVADVLIAAGIEESASARNARELDERAARLHPEVPATTELLSVNVQRFTEE
jgi:hypothetical protein